MHDTLVVVRLPVAHSPAVGGELGLVLQGNVLPLDLNKYLKTWPLEINLLNVNVWFHVSPQCTCPGRTCYAHDRTR